MRLLYVQLGSAPRMCNVPHELSAFQELVGGRIEVVEPFDDSVALVCDESGRINGKPVNRMINENMDVCGDFFICGHDGMGLTDMPENLISKYSKILSL